MNDSQPISGLRPAYVALPAQGFGPGVVVLHAWWGFNDFFRQLCDRLAAEGFVVAAPDLYGGATAETIEAAQQLLDRSDEQRMRAAANSAIDYLRDHPAVTGDSIGLIGFSMGGAWALLLSTLCPEDISAVVLFYGNGEGDFAKARAAYLGHFGDPDEWEPIEGVRDLEARLRDAGRDVTLHLYDGAGHWFFESNRPDAFDSQAAELAWERTVAFLHDHLG
jgi:carboxymethylenebutenolidase